jgi:glutamate-1-semialdehyde 2,1-aminomutase
LIEDEAVYPKLERLGAMLEEGLQNTARKAGVSIRINRVGSQMTLFFNREPVIDYLTAKGSDTSLFGKFFVAMLERGVYLPPSQFEAFFLSTAHTSTDLEKTLAAAREAFKRL